MTLLEENFRCLSVYGAYNHKITIFKIEAIKLLPVGDHDGCEALALISECAMSGPTRFIPN